MLYAKNVFVILILFCKANFTKTVSGATEVEVNGNFYDLQGVDAIPLGETYNVVIERHGVQTPWD